MIKFFRRIRQQFIKENHIKKYALYAIGEIFLVVIGILIALQLNNWNEARKEKKTEIKLLIEIQNDLNETLREIESDYNSHLRSQNKATVFQKFLLKNEIYNDTILRYYNRIFRDRQVYPKTSGYELLQSKGVDIISNDVLRKGITDLYQLSFSRLIEYGSSNEQFNIPSKLIHFENKHFTITDIPDNEYMTEGLNEPVIFYQNKLNNYSELRNDKDFLRALQNSFDLRKLKIYRHERAMEHTKEVLGLIDNELRQLK